MIRLLKQFRRYSNKSDFGTPQEYIAKWTKFFNDEAYDRFELCRGLNNCFGYDIIPPVQVLESALKACRRLDDYATAVRIFGGLKNKCDTNEQYSTYLTYLRPLMNELGVCTPDELGRYDY